MVKVPRVEPSASPPQTSSPRTLSGDARSLLEERPDPLESRRRAAQGERVPLTVRLLVGTRDEFIQTYYPDVLQGGMFIRTDAPEQLTLGLRVQLRFLSRAGDVVFGGQGVIAWVQKSGERGLGLQFVRLAPDSHLAYREMLRLRRTLDERRREREREPARRAPEWAEAPTRSGRAADRTLAATPRTMSQGNDWLEAPTRPVPGHAAQRLVQASRLPRPTPPRRPRRSPPPLPPRRSPPPRPELSDDVAAPHLVAVRQSDPRRSSEFADKIVMPLEDR